MSDTEIRALEGLLFLWGEPLDIKDISKALDLTERETLEVIQSYEQELLDDRRAFVLKKYNNTYQLVTKKDIDIYIKKLVDTDKGKKISNSAMEVLAIIAYKQPITKVEVDNIRGVKSSSAFETLISKELIEEAGRLEKIGRPILYKTTNKFLQYFDIERIEELPNLSHFIEKEDIENENK